MHTKIAIFWPGDYRTRPNEQALPHVTEATGQLERALQKLGRRSYRVAGFLTKPHEAVEKLGPIDDPLIGVCVHWVYGPHTTDGVVGKDNPLLLASNFSGTWPGLVGVATGMNEKGLAAADLVVMTRRGSPQPGVPVFFALRSLLENQDSLASAVEYLKQTLGAEAEELLTLCPKCRQYDFGEKVKTLEPGSRKVYAQAAETGEGQ